MHRFLLVFALAVPLFAGPRDIDKSRPVDGRAWVLRPAVALSEADETALAERGVTVLHALSDGRYLARVRDGATVDDERMIGAEPLEAEQKLHPTALRAATLGRPLADIHVVFHRDVPFDEARAALLAAGGAMDVFALRYLPSHRIEARISPAALQALAEDERVFAISGRRVAKVRSDNAVTAQTSHVTELYGAPYGLSGSGVAVSLFELAPAQASHTEFGGRLVVDASGGSSSDQRHATHVAGTIGASGLNAAAKGMAPASNIFQFCVAAPGINTCGSDWLTLKDEKLSPLGVVVDNNSWGYIWGWEDGNPPVWNEGDRYWGAYDLILAAPIDEISIDRNLLFVHSAGNDANLPSGLNTEWKNHLHYSIEDEANRPGTYCVSKSGTGTDCPAGCNGETDLTAGVRPCELALHHPLTPFDTLGTTASAKNILSVGAVNNDLSIISFSSRGPAKDGRVKPDVVARGANVLSTVPTNAYSLSSGTSMAAPAVTGVAALLTEQWRRTNSGANPRPAQLKALMIAGAGDIGNPGPDYTFGFGLVNARASVDLIRADEGKGNRIRSFTFSQGANDVDGVTVVNEQTQTLRAVLVWSDPAIPYLGGDDIAAKSLVNDIDLYVVDPNGITWHPWTLDRATVDALATRAPNKVDNVEMVEIPNAAPGAYRIFAAGRTITQGPQQAALVTNARPARPCTDVQEASGAGNDTADRATAIASSAIVYAGLCAITDVDFYSFAATKLGPLTVTVRAGDTPLKVTMTGIGVDRVQEVPPNSTAVLSAPVNVAPIQITVKVEAAGAFGPEPQYTLEADFPETRKPKRRTARR